MRKPHCSLLLVLSGRPDRMQAPISWTGTSCPTETAGNWTGTFVVTSNGAPVTVGP